MTIPWPSIVAKWVNYVKLRIDFHCVCDIITTMKIYVESGIENGRKYWVNHNNLRHAEETPAGWVGFFDTMEMEEFENERQAIDWVKGLIGV